MFDIQLPGVQGKSTATGKFIGMLDLETARISVPDNSRIPKGVYFVKSEDITAIKAVLPDDYVEEKIAEAKSEIAPAPKAFSFSNPNRRGAPETETYLKLAEEEKPEAETGIQLRQGLFGDSGQIADEDKKTLKEFISNDLMKSILKKSLDEIQRGQSIKPENMPKGWRSVDPGEAFFTEYGVTIEELNQFVSMDISDSNIDNPIFNDSKKFILTEFKKRFGSLISWRLTTQDEIPSLKVDHYVSDNGTLIKMKHVQYKDQETKEFGESFTVTNEATMTSMMDTYSKLNEQYPIGRPIEVVLSSQVGDTFEVFTESHGDYENMSPEAIEMMRNAKVAAAYAGTDGSIRVNFTREGLSITGTRNNARDMWLERLSDPEEEKAFIKKVGYSRSDIENIEEFHQITHILAHEYGHLYDYTFIGSSNWKAPNKDETPITEAGKKIKELYEKGSSMPTLYGSTNSAEFFAEHFAQNFVKGSSVGEKSKEVIETINAFKGAAPVEDVAQDFKDFRRISPMAWDYEPKADYRVSHKAPNRENEDANAANLDELYPKDIYDKNKRARLYSSGFPQADRESFAAIDAINRNPDAEVQIFRAVPDEASQINPGDWVTLSPSYAQAHLESNLGGKGFVIRMLAKASDLFTDGNSINEWGWDPEDKTSRPVQFREDKLSAKQIEALKWYTDNGYFGANNYLRNGAELTEEDQLLLVELLQLIEQSKTLQDITVYRGRPVVSQERLDAINALKPGDKITDRGLMSTSQDKSRAEFYAQMKIGGNAKAEIMFEILIPKGSSAYRIPDKYSSYKDSEQEILLKPSTELEVVEVTTDEIGRKYIKVKAI